MVAGVLWKKRPASPVNRVRYAHKNFMGFTGEKKKLAGVGRAEQMNIFQ